MELLSCIGAIAVAVVALRVLYFVYFYTLMPGTSLSKYGGRQGAWAVVTGASDGIGKAYVHELARQGFNVVMVSRTRSKMEAIASEVKSKFNADSRIVAVDASANTPETWSKIEAALREVTSEQNSKLTMLVNNVAASVYPLCPYSEMTAAQIDELINVNVFFSAKMTALCLPMLLANKKSAIIELSSLFSKTAVPFNGLYSATKAFNFSLSQTLAAELKRSGCDVMCVKPGYVMTNMTKFRRTSLAIISPERLVRSSLRYLGRTTSVSPYWFHGVEQMLLDTVPGPILNMFLFNKMATARKAQLRKIGSTAKTQ